MAILVLSPKGCPFHAYERQNIFRCIGNQILPHLKVLGIFTRSWDAASLSAKWESDKCEIFIWNGVELKFWKLKKGSSMKEEYNHSIISLSSPPLLIRSLHPLKNPLILLIFKLLVCQHWWHFLKHKSQESFLPPIQSWDHLCLFLAPSVAK